MCCHCLHIHTLARPFNTPVRARTADQRLPVALKGPDLANVLEMGSYQLRVCLQASPAVGLLPQTLPVEICALLAGNKASHAGVMLCRCNRCCTWGCGHCVDQARPVHHCGGHHRGQEDLPAHDHLLQIHCGHDLPYLLHFRSAHHHLQLVSKPLGSLSLLANWRV